MADTTEKKTWLINIESNIQKYIDELKKAEAELIKAENAVAKMKEGNIKSKDEIEKTNAALRNAQKEYSNAKKSVDLAVQANKAQKGSYEELYRSWQLAQTQLKLMGGAYETNAQGVRVLSQKYIEQKKVVEDAKRSLDAFGKGVADNRLNVGNYSEAIQGAIGKFQAMPGPIGGAANAVKGLSATFKALLANPIVAVIAALVAALVGLVKIFKSTAEGGGKIKDLMAGLGGIMNELRARVVAFMDVFKNIFKGDFKAAAASWSDATDDLAKSLGESAKNAMDLSAQQRALTKELAMHVSEEANEVNKIQELLYLSKDKNKTDAERLAYLKEALALGKEQAEQELGFAKRQWDIDVATAANKAKIDKKVLADWVAMDADAQMEMLKNRQDIQEAYNLLGGADALKALEESYSKQIEASTEFFAHNKRAISQSSGLEDELRKERERKYQEHLDRMKKAQDDNIKLMFLRAKGDADAMKAAYKFQLDEQLKDKKLSDTEKLILQEEYRLAINEINKKEVDDNKAKLKKEIDDQIEYITNQQAAAQEWDDWIAERKLINAENQLAIDELQHTWEYQLQRDYLDLEYEQEIANAQKTGADKNLIEKKYALARKEIDRAEADAKLGLWSGFAGNLATIFGKNTAIGKAAAVAQAIIDTYLSATKAFTSLADVPVVGPVLGAAAAAAAIASGMANVKKILEVKSGLPGEGSVSAPTSITASVPAQRTFATPTGSTVLTSANLSQTQLNALPNQNLLTAEQIALAVSKLPAPIVTVEDINAKTAAVQKVAVRANI